MPKSSNISIPHFDNFEMVFIAKVQWDKVVGFDEYFSHLNESINALLRDINLYIILIIRGAAFYNLRSIPNILVYREQIGLFFKRHFAQFVEIDIDLIRIKNEFDLNSFINSINSLPNYKKEIPPNSESDSD